MTSNGFLQLVLRTVTEPRAVATYLIELRLSREVLATAFALVVTLNTLVFSGSLILMPVSDGLPALFGSPTLFLAMLSMSLLLTIVSVTLTGRIFGGRATFDQMAVLVIWMQGLRVMVQVGLTVLAPFGGFLSSMVAMFATGLGLWILIHFIAVAHGFPTLGKAIITLITAVIGLGVALSVIFSVIGVNSVGLN